MNTKLIGIIGMFLASLGLVSAATDIYHPPNPVDYVKIVSVFVLVLSLYLVTGFGKRFAMKHKQFFFLLFAVPVVLSALYLGMHTVYENSISATKGPVHWHADYRVLACGEEYDLIDPAGLRNKIGTPVLHEHDDHRIHVEGTVVQLSDVHLGVYFNVIGGYLSQNRIVYPTNDGIVEFQNGDQCPDGSIGELAVYVNGDRISQPQRYLLAPEIFVPDGDCIIFLFEENPGDTTDILCPSWEAQDVNYDNFNPSREATSPDGRDHGVMN